MPQSFKFFIVMFFHDPQSWGNYESIQKEKKH